jgi:hypothetical protein
MFHLISDLSTDLEDTKSLLHRLLDIKYSICLFNEIPVVFLILIAFSAVLGSQMFLKRLLKTVEMMWMLLKQLLAKA